MNPISKCSVSGQI